jgi:DNA-dependent RNA polymerase auxiliary subunit epsilon
VVPFLHAREQKVRKSKKKNEFRTSFVELLMPPRCLLINKKQKCVLWYESYGSAVAVRRKFRIFYHVNNHQTPIKNSILNWYRKFGDTGSVKNKRRSGRPAVN